MTTKDVIDRSSSFEEMVRFLASCEENVPTNDFDRLGNKSLRQLYQEITGINKKGERVALPEIILERNPITGVADRVGKGVKSMITNPEAGAMLVEVSREFANGVVIETYDPLNPWGISGTLYLGESPIEGLRRELREELLVKNVKLKKLEAIAVDPTYHRSTVYPGVYSRIRFTWFDLKTFQLHPQYLPLPRIADNGVYTNRKWIEYKEAA